QFAMMLPVAEERDAQPAKIGQRAVVPVIAVRVGQKGSVDVGPGRADGSETFGQQAGAEADVQQEAVAPGLEQTGVAAAAAGQDRESQRHPFNPSGNLADPAKY